VQQDAQATSLLVILPTSIVATVVLRRRGVVPVGPALKIGALGAVAAAAGAAAALVLPSEALRVVFAAFLMAVGVRLVVQARGLGKEAST
jgi:uncharacterized protein